MSEKQQSLDVVKGMPNNATLADIQHRLHIIASVNKGQREIRQGKGIPHSKAFELLRKNGVSSCLVAKRDKMCA
jgi:hypothetical protein